GQRMHYLLTRWKNERTGKTVNIQYFVFLSPEGVPDQAMMTKGGIDLNNIGVSQTSVINARGTAAAATLENIQGLTPVLINIQNVSNLQVLFVSTATPLSTPAP